MSQPLAIAKQFKAEIIDQVRSGKILREIAPTYGISPQAIWASLHDDPDYRAALHGQAHSMIEECKDETWRARQGIDIARAREMSKFAFRYAESIDAGTWGQKTGAQINIAAAGDMQVQIVSFADVQQSQRTIENASDGNNSSVMLNEKQADGT